MIKKYIINYRKLSNIEKYKATKVFFYSFLIVLFIYFLLDIFYFKFVKEIKFPIPIFFFIGTLLYASIEKKMKKRINDEFILNNNTEKKEEGKQL